MRVFVTGVGIVSPLAIGAGKTMDRLLSGARAFRTVTLFDTTGQRTNYAAEVTGLSVADVAPAADRQTWSRTDAMATVAEWIHIDYRTLTLMCVSAFLLLMVLELLSIVSQQDRKITTLAQMVGILMEKQEFGGEIRNPKPEIRMKSEARMTKPE